MLLTFAIQHRGILGTANVQKYIGLSVIIPMFIVGVVPILTGQINWSNYSPLVPLAAAYAPEPGTWNIAGLDARPRRHVHRRVVDLRL